MNQKEKVRIEICPSPECFEAELGRGELNMFEANFNKVADYNYSIQKYILYWTGRSL